MSEPQIEQNANVQMAAFSLEGAAGRSYVEGDYRVYPDCRLFQAGDYPDKGLSVTPEELHEIAQNFTPVPGDLEHFFARAEEDGISHERLGTLTALRGQLGEVRKVRVGEDNWLLGDVTVPLWLDRNLPGKGLSAEIPVSGPKKLLGYTITTKPRVTGAALMSTLAQFAGARHSSQDLADLQSTHDLVVKQGAACSPAKMSISNPYKETSKMSFADKVKAWFNAGMPAEFSVSESGDPEPVPSPQPTPTPTPTPPSPEPAPTPTPNPALAQMSAENKALMQRVEEIEEERRQERAALFAERVVRAGKRAPSEYNSVLMSYLRAARDDSAHPQKVTFSGVDGQGKPQTIEYASRIAQLEAEYEAAPTIHTLTQDHSDKLSDARVLFNSATPSSDKQKSVEEETEAYLSTTTEGRAALARAKAAQNGK